MKILHITAAYKPAITYGGPTMSVAMLCEELVKAGVTINVFTTTANGAIELPVATKSPVNVDGVTVNYFSRVTKDHTHFSPALLKALWSRAKDFDVIHIHAWWNLVSILSCFIALSKKVPVIISPRGMLSPYSFTNKNMGIKNLIHRTLGLSMLKKSRIHATSVHEATAVSEIVDALTITTIPNFVKLPPREIYPQKTVSGEIKLLFFSRIEEKKGLDILLNALKSVKVPYHLTIAGDGNADYIYTLKSLAISNGIDSHITWAGFYDEGKFDMVRSHHLLVLPSHDENFGNVVIESLSVGTAVLVSEHVGLANYVVENHLGWVCQTTVASVSNAITDIITNQTDALQTISTVAPGKVYNDFTGKALIQQYILLYQNTIR